ncbi:DUF3883 domain-containing protein [Sphingobacteriales bacterium UPWRP_1]|nr:hypothetical protein B6N25_11245 [Sphingobacteriales bacterium TSM_CSS]PSJ77557.1 DUF3883 domain-containing protein [Sphingobacteriales bacterium UPWRP_1]
MDNVLSKLFELKPPIDFHTGNYAKALTKLINNAFTKTQHFIFELIQNADDSPSRKGDLHIEIDIYYFDHYILFQHNGSPFFEGDVVSICSVGYSDLDNIPINHFHLHKKSHDPDKIGYKGIGFKSVFRLSNCCYIISGDYKFKFDANFEGWKDHKYPWQLIPLEFSPNELPMFISNLLDTNKTNIIIKLTDDLIDNTEKRDIIYKNSKTIASTATILLYLRHIKSIKVHNGNMQLSEIQRQDIDKSIRKLSKKNGRLDEKYFLTEKFTVDIPDNINGYLKTLSDEQCPEKHKKAKSVAISFAAELAKEADKFVLKEHNYDNKGLYLFSYLPTNVKLSFPFVINAEFLLDEGRSNILSDNMWNEFLFGNIASLLFKWFSIIVKSNYDFKFEFLKLYRRKFINTQESMPHQSPYNVKFDEALKVVRFIPPQNESHEDFLLVEESIVDYTGFNHQFNTTNDAAKILKKDGLDIAHEKIYKIERLLDIGASKFADEELWALLKSVQFTNNIETSVKLISYLHNYLKKDKDSTTFSNLHDIAFLLDENLCWRTPVDVFLPANHEILPYGLEVDVHYINDDIIQYINENIEIKMWLASIGLKEPSTVGLARKVIDTYLDDTDNIDINTAIRLGRYFFAIFRHLDEKLLTTLSQKLPVVCNVNQLTFAQLCYLSDYYKPELPLQNSLADNGVFFVSPEYVSKGQSLSEWKAFWKKISVSEQMIKVQIPPNLNGQKVCRTDLIRQLPEIEGYFTFLDEKPEYNLAVRNFRNEPNQHHIRNLYSVTFVEKTENNPLFAETFWNHLIEFKIININRDSTEYFHRLNQNSNRGESVPTYIQFFARRKQCLPDTNSICRVSGDLFSPDLEMLVTNVFPTVKLPNLNKEWAEYLGIKTKLTLDDCLKILEYCAKQQVNNNLISRIENTYKYMIETLKSHTSDEAHKQAQSWMGLLLAADNTFKKPSELYFFNLPNAPLPNNRESFLKDSNLQHEVMLQVATLFNLKIISANELEPLTHDEYESNELKSLVKSRLSFITKLVHFKSGEPPEDTRNRVLQTLDSIKFYICTNLEIVYSKNSNLYKKATVTYFNSEPDCKFYYIQNWRQAENLILLSKELSKLLKFISIEIEMQLFLTLDDGSIARWLRSMGIDVRNEIGRIGENQTFELLKQEFIRNFPNTQVQESENSVAIKDGETLLLSLQWNNQNEEKFQPYDFYIETYEGETANTIYIETKTTSDETNDIIYLTPSEWEFMLKNPNNYIIYRIYLSYQNNYQLDKYHVIKQPLQYIHDARLLLLDTTGFLNSPPNEVPPM